MTAIVVNYNAGPLLTACILSVLNSNALGQCIVSDNGSSDSSLDLLRGSAGNDPRLTILENEENLGFAAGNNRGLMHARGRHILFLNPDCVVQSDTLSRLVAFMEGTPEAGMVGCTVRNPDGSEQVASRRAIPNPGIGLVRVLHLDRLWPSLAKGRRLNLTDEPLPTQPLRVEAVSGSFMLVRREALAEVGPLDEGYFLHCEDLDWFVRFARAGWGIYLVPDVEVVHHKGACSATRPVRVEWHKHRGMARFFRKFQFRDYPLPLSLLVLGGIWAHFAVWTAASSARRLLGAVARNKGAS